MEISISLWILMLKLSCATTPSELRQIRMDDTSWHRQYILDRRIIIWMQFKQVLTLEEFKLGLHHGMLGKNQIEFRATVGERLSLWRLLSVTQKWISGWRGRKKSDDNDSWKMVADSMRVQVQLQKEAVVWQRSTWAYHWKTGSRHWSPNSFGRTASGGFSKDL